MIASEKGLASLIEEFLPVSDYDRIRAIRVSIQYKLQDVLHRLLKNWNLPIEERKTVLGQWIILALASCSFEEQAKELIAELQQLGETTQEYLGQAAIECAHRGYGQLLRKFIESNISNEDRRHAISIIESEFPQFIESFMAVAR